MRYMKNTIQYRHFTKNSRSELSILLKKGYSQRDIAKVLGINHSSISREIKENSVNAQYDVDKAHHKSRTRRTYSKYQAMKIITDSELKQYIQSRLVKGWTPEEISGRLKDENDGQTIISFKSIYKYLETSHGQAFKKYLPLWSKRKKKRKKRKKKVIEGRVFIDQRSSIINDRIRCGDFEGDTLGVPKFSMATIAAVVDRKSLYFRGKKINRPKEAISAFKELSDTVDPLSITLDNGMENVHYRELNLDTYFTHPYAAWEKPYIENTFQRLRRYIPKKAKLVNYSDKEISDIIDMMNNTPRKTLGFRTPKEVYFKERYNQVYQLQLNLKCCT